MLLKGITFLILYISLLYSILNLIYFKYISFLLRIDQILIQIFIFILILYIESYL